MQEHREKRTSRIVVFRKGTPEREKRRSLFFFTLLTLIVLAQACYWVFANRVEPILMGMPFGMFTVVALIIIEFVVLVALYRSEPDDEKESR